MKRLRLVLVAMVAAFLLAVPAFAYADSFIGTVTVTGILEQAMEVVPYFGGVVLMILGVTAGIWGITFVINKLARAFKRGR